MNGSNGIESFGADKKSTVRRLVLALVLGLLGASILIMTANAYVAVKIQDTLLDFDRGTFSYTGLLDIPPDIDSVQLLPVGLTGDWGSANLKLPRRLKDLAATILHGDVIFVVGGNDAQFNVRPEVYTTIISDIQGTLAPWQTQPSLPEARTGAGIAVRPSDGGASTIYVVGGLGPGNMPPGTDSVFRAEVDNDTGDILGDWATDAQTIPEPLFYASAVQHHVNGQDYLYVLGGVNGLESFDSVHYASINANGSLNAFAPTSPLPERLFDGYAVVYDGAVTDTLYYIGGAYITGTLETLATEQVYFADFLPDGSLTAWQRSEGALPRPLYAHDGVLVRQGEIMTTGGIDNPLDPLESFTATVKAALVDPTNPSFRLYDWCEGVPPPACTFGAWQTGALLPEVRAAHGTVTGHGLLYVMGGWDGNQNVVDTIFLGTVNGAGALYAPEGTYRSDKIDLEQPATLRRLTWETTLVQPDKMGLAMQYRTSTDGFTWTSWSEPVGSQHGSNFLDTVDPSSDTQYVQYQASLTTALTNASPLLDEVRIFYEVEDPDVSVIKDTGSVITVELGSTLQYTIHYTNTGGWVAENTVLTETLPDHTTYAGDASWQQVGSSNVYTHSVGNVERGANGSATFQVQVNEQVPAGTLHITNRVEIDYPPMIDAFEQTIVDPNWDDNWFEFGNPLSIFALTVTKDADPPPGSIVTPGSVITYTVGYKNLGNKQASQAVLTDTFDPLGNYTVLDPSLPPGTPEYVWDLGPLGVTQGGEKTIVVRLADELPNNWLVSNRASLYSPERMPYHSEVITHTVMNYLGPNPKPMVDFSITDVHWSPSNPVSGTWPSFYATVVNAGTADATLPFWIALYIKPSPSDPPEWPSDHDRGYCLENCTKLRPQYVAYIRELGEGESAPVAFQYLNQDVSPDFPASNAYDLYLQVDVAFEDDNPYWGIYPEDNEYNNLWQGYLYIPETSNGPPWMVYLPILYKNLP